MQASSHWSEQKKFALLKFRTMEVQTNLVPTHLVDPRSITRLGYFLRQTKLDELAQFYNVLFRNMSLLATALI